MLYWIFGMQCNNKSILNTYMQWHISCCKGLDLLFRDSCDWWAMQIWLMLSLRHLREVHIRLSPSVAVEACGSDVRCQTRPDIMDGVSRGDHCHLPPHSSLQQAYKNCTPSPVKPRGTSARSFSCCSKQLVWLQADQYLASLPLLAREMMRHEKLWHWLGPGGGAWVLVSEKWSCY